MKVTSVMSGAFLISAAIVMAGGLISMAIRDTKIQVTIPQNKTTIQLPDGYKPAKPWPEGVLLPRPENVK